MLNGKRARKHQHGGNVAEELEIKLTVDESSLGSVIHWLLAQSGARDGGRKSLVNRYYDTPEVDLNQQRAALRVRQAGDRFIQTLKTQGEFVAGAHRRQEWEWELPGPELNIGLLADTPLGQDVNLARLQAVFETNQVVDVHDKPGEPGDDAGELDRAHFRNRLVSPDGGHGTFIEVTEGFDGGPF